MAAIKISLEKIVFIFLASGSDCKSEEVIAPRYQKVIA
jgi:hypothetical protein